jgi:hypothetical protein
MEQRKVSVVEKGKLRTIIKKLTQLVREASRIAARDVEGLLPGVHVLVEPRDVAGRVVLEFVVAVLRRPAGRGIVRAPVISRETGQVLVERAGVATSLSP